MDSIHSPLHKIGLVGFGCCGKNALKNLKDVLDSHIDLFEFDTDARGMQSDERITRLAIGAKITHGKSAGAIPEIGRLAAEESINEMLEMLSGYDLLFLTGGLGGGTATGALPILAQQLKALGVLTIFVMTTPFEFEGKKKQRYAEQAVEELKSLADAYILVSNQKLLHSLPKTATLVEAFNFSNQVLKQSVLGIYTLITNTGYINLDFADVRSVLTNSGQCVIGLGSATGHDRAEQAVKTALFHPLLNEFDLTSAKSVLINITSNHNLQLDELSLVGEQITKQLGDSIPIITGTVVSESNDDELIVYVILSGLCSVKKQM